MEAGEEWNLFHIYDNMVVEYNDKRWYLPEFKPGEDGNRRVRNLTVKAMDADKLGWSDATGSEQKIGDLKELKEKVKETKPLQGYNFWGDLSGYEPDIMNNYVYYYDGKGLYIIFGAENEELQAYNYNKMWGRWGHWNYEKNRLIITEYDLDMSDVTGKDTITLTEMNGPGILKLSPDKVLLAGIRNKVNLRLSSYNPGYTVFFNNKEKINKTGKLNKNDNTIDYTVTMNTIDSTVWGYFEDVKKDLYAKGEGVGWVTDQYYDLIMQAVFYDELPDGWEYVEGSLFVTTQDIYKNKHYFVYAAAEAAGYDKPPVKEDEGKQVIEAPLNFFFEPSRLEGKPGLELFNTFSSTLAQIIFTYKLKAADDWLAENANIDDSVPVKNHVEIRDREDTHWSTDAVVPYIPAKLTKPAEQVGSSNRLRFTLQVNSNGKMFAQEDPSGKKLEPQSYLIVTDKSTNLKITEDTITVKTKDGDALKFGGSVTEEELKNITEWPANTWRKLPVDEENQFFRLVVPNGVALTVQYEALVLTIGNNVPVSNQAGIEGIATSNIEYDRSLKVSYIDAGGSGSNYELTIQKVDKNDKEKGLKGAKFRFYIVMPEKESEKESEKSILLEKEEETEVSIKTEQITIGEETYNCMTESNWTFETGEGGRFKMADDNEKNLHWNLYPDYYYILVEEEAPSGYDKLKEPIST